MLVNGEVCTILLQSIDSKFPGERRVAQWHLEFENDEISLDIKIEGVELESGWKISPRTLPKVSLF